MLAPVFLAAALSMAPPSFTLKQKPPVLTPRQAEAIAPCRKLNAQLAADRKQTYRERGARIPKGQYAVVRRIGGCSVSAPMR